MKTTAELEARIAELEAAVKWALGEDNSEFGDIINPVPGKYWWRDELRARAFPPKFEEVEAKRWECPFCTMTYHDDPYNTKPPRLLLNDCCNKAREKNAFIILVRQNNEGAEMKKWQQIIFEVRPDERVVGVCSFRDVVILATDQRVYRIKNPDCDDIMRVEVVGVTA